MRIHYIKMKAGLGMGPTGSTQRTFRGEMIKIPSEDRREAKKVPVGVWKKDT
jgi:hypothetical protein